MIIDGTFPRKGAARAPVAAPEPEVRGGADLPQPRSGAAEADERTRQFLRRILEAGGLTPARA